MDALSLALVLALNAVPGKSEEIDFDAASRAAQVELDSPYLNAQVLSAMAMPYKYGVTQLPCKAQEWQPARHWHPAREPSGRIQWLVGTRTKVFWSGIYGTCFIEAPLERDRIGVVERTALECECNGWLPDK